MLALLEKSSVEVSLEGVGLHASMSTINLLKDDTLHAGFSSYGFLSLPPALAALLSVLWSLLPLLLRLFLLPPSPP